MEEYKKRLNELMSKIDIPQKKQEIETIEKESANPDFWKNHNEAAEKMKRLAILQKQLDEVDLLRAAFETNDISYLSKNLEKMELIFFLSGTYDENNAILSIHAGQG